jgi:hypothetical protein
LKGSVGGSHPIPFSFHIFTFGTPICINVVLKFIKFKNDKVLLKTKYLIL